MATSRYRPDPAWGSSWFQPRSRSTALAKSGLSGSPKTAYTGAISTRGGRSDAACFDWHRARWEDDAGRRVVRLGRKQGDSLSPRRSLFDTGPVLPDEGGARRDAGDAADHPGAFPALSDLLPHSRRG